MDWRPFHATTLIGRSSGNKLRQFPRSDSSISALKAVYSATCKRWDDQWQPGRHAKDIALLDRGIEKLEAWIKNNCGCK